MRIQRAVANVIAGSSFLLLLAGLFLARKSTEKPSPLRAVEKLDLDRYMGDWYEIAKFPNWFERKCVSDIMAHYEKREDGTIQVVNSCVTDSGKLKESVGTARLAKSDGPASKLKVSFFKPFEGNYWVIVLDEDYQYAVIGEPSMKYLWLLSRSPVMSDELYMDIVSKIRATGYDVSRLERVAATRAEMLYK